MQKPQCVKYKRTSSRFAIVGPLEITVLCPVTLSPPISGSWTEDAGDDIEGKLWELFVAGGN